MKNSADKYKEGVIHRGRRLNMKVQYDKVLSKFGQQQLVMVNNACGFNQSKTRKYFE